MSDQSLLYPPISASCATDDRQSQAETIAHLQSLLQFDQEILDTLPMMVGVFDVISYTIFRMVKANRALSQKASMSHAEMIGKLIEEILLPEDAAQSILGFQQCLDTDKVVVTENHYSLPAGSIWAQTTRIPIRDPHGQITRVLVTVQDITAARERERAEQQRHAEIIERQTATLAELSTPMLTISDTTVVMPLVGAIDSQRIQQIMDNLLSGVAESQAKAVILDITGVPIVDTQVASALIRASQAVSLLGSQVILTGIRPEVAQTLVGLGVELRGIITRGTLQDGIAYALRRL